MRKIYVLFGLAMLICVCGVLLNDADESDAATVYGGGTQNNPYTYVDINANELRTYFNGTKYIQTGSTVTVHKFYDSDL